MSQIGLVTERPAIRLRHTGLVVEDLEKEVKFYTEVLGFRIVKTTNEDSKFISIILGISNPKLKTVKLTLEKETGTLLELLTFEGKIQQRKVVVPDNFGYTHIALTVINLDLIYREMKKLEIEFLSEPTISPDGYAKVAFCRDPENNMIELVEVLKI